MPRIDSNLRLPVIIGSLGLCLCITIIILMVYDLNALLAILPSPRLFLLSLFLGLGLAFALLIAIVRENQQHLQSTQAELETTQNRENQHQSEHKNLESVLSQGQKLLAVGTLAGGVAHDFNNLLYAIQGYTEMCRQDAPTNPALIQNLNKILEATVRGQALVARILTFSRRHHRQTSPLSLKATFEGVLALVNPTIPSSVSIELSLPEDITILANQTELHQVIVNLITNAVDAMDGQGRIQISACSANANDPALKHFPNLVHPRYAVITVTDSGVGMDESTLNRIFEPFYTTKEVGKGTGLGLSIVHSILTEHQGNIRAESELGHGTTFTLLLPEYPKSVKEHP